MAEIWVVAAGIAGFAGVALGAAGAHLAGGDVHAADLIATASRYVLLHGAALVGVAALARDRSDPALALAGTGFALGSLLFAGGLTLFALTQSAMGQCATPLGGTTLLAGWVALAVHGLSRRARPPGAGR
jgi:uncharacterized membrane protein YgdD (TMEM256/DUF423 family)